MSYKEPIPFQPPQTPHQNRSALPFPQDNASSSTPPSNFQTLSYRIAVIGAARAGKTTFISKGFKRFQISKEARPEEARSSTGSRCGYTVRVAKTRFGESPGHAIHAEIVVMEVRLEDLETFVWPDYMPHLSAAFVCYDASSDQSVDYLSKLLDDLHSKHVRTTVVACKCDLTRKIEPRAVAKQIKKYDAGLVEVESTTKNGKNKMRFLVDWSIRQHLEPNSTSNDYTSVDIDCLTTSAEPGSEPPPCSDSILHSPIDSPETPLAPRSNAIIADYQHSNDIENDDSRHQLPRRFSFPSLNVRVDTQHTPSRQQNPVKTFPVQAISSTTEIYQSLDTLFRRLFHAAVSGNDTTFIDAFLLTYCRFATPKILLTAFYTQLEIFSNNVSLTDTEEFSFLRICSLLQQWTNQYPHDFGAPGVRSTFGEVMRLISRCPNATGYYLSFKVFEARNPKPTVSYRTWDVISPDLVDPAERSKAGDHGDKDVQKTSEALRPPSLLSQQDPKCSLKQLRDVASKINIYAPEVIAEEITRMQLELFLRIEPRDWVYHVLVTLKTSGPSDSVSRFADLHNQLGSWTTSLILCHDHPKMRSRQMAKFIEVGKELRKHHNYAGLRAVTVGILNATYEGDKSMELLGESSPALEKSLLSHQKLFSSSRAHEAYRLAIRNVVGPMIPETEIHTYDIVRIQEVNSDFHPSDRFKIHWGKFNVTGRVVGELSRSQRRCRRSNKLIFPERRDIGDCIRKIVVMDAEMRHSRLPQPEGFEQGAHSPPGGLKKLASMLR